MSRMMAGRPTTRTVGDAARTCAAVAAMLALAAPAWALTPPCYDFIPGNCQPQVQAPISYTGWQTQGWAYYCTGDHPYYYGLNQDFGGVYSFDNSCFSVAENAFAESGNDHKFDALITNWCFTTQQIVVTLACSDKPK